MKSRDASSTTNNEVSSKTIVCVYTQNDESFYRELQTYLSLWQREGYIQWLETPAGSDAKLMMQAHLQQADLILLLISPDFFAQDDCYSAMKTSLQEQARRQVPVVPVLARASAWKGSVCGNLLALPGNQQPIVEWVHPEQAYEEIRFGLARLLPSDMNFRQKPMQETARSGADPTSPWEREEAQKHGAIAQPGSVNIVNLASNNGHIGNVYGDVHNHR
jgi:TIR domain